MRRFGVGVLVLVSALAVLLASTSLWTRRNVINTQVFVSNVETTIDLPAVEARITEQVTTTVMGNQDVQDAIDDAVAALPERLQRFQGTVEEGIRSLVSTGVRRLLAEDPFRPLTEAALTSAQSQLVNGQPVRFTLGQAKDRVPASAQDGIAGQILDLLPDDVGITLLTPAGAPEVYNAVDLLESVWWWLGLLALVTLAAALWVSRHRRGTLRAWAVTTTVLLLLLLITLRVARGRVVVAARPENRDAVGAVYDVFAGSLRSWTLWLLGAVLLVFVLTLVWGRLGIVAGIRRGSAAARAQLQRRREERRLAQAAAEGAEPGTAPAAPVADEPWTRRVAAWTTAFTAGLELPARTERLGGYARDHEKQARWLGIVVGAVVLLFWPAPTLSVLIWIAALVALYLGALAWLVGRAAEPAPAEPAEPAGPPPAVPVPRPAANGVLVGAAVGARQAAPEPEPLVPAALTPEAISTLNGRLELLVRLGAARDAGVLTDEEFGREKARLLGV
ncbi:SHOCT domain-containing protein [Geodermatophilus sp. SYSU D00691]